LVFLSSFCLRKSNYIIIIRAIPHRGYGCLVGEAVCILEGLSERSKIFEDLAALIWTLQMTIVIYDGDLHLALS
jgi:hypothetical protein